MARSANWVKRPCWSRGPPARRGWPEMTAVCSLLIPLYLALLLDLALGDPPNRYHPVAWMGSLILALRRLAESRSQQPWSKLACGVGLVATGLALSIAAGWLIEAGLARLPK